MAVNSAAGNVLGTIGTICWTGQIIPQIWKNWRAKVTEGLSHWLMLIWGVASAFLGVFTVVQNLNIPLRIQPQLFGFLSLVAWSQCLYYDHKMPLRQTVTILIGTLLILGGFEAGMIFAIRPAVDNGNKRPIQFFGIMTSILLAAGLLPQFLEIYRLGEVRGISLLFMFIDTMGGVFSLLSLVFASKFDILAGVAYSLVIVLDSVVIILAIILNPRAERKRKRLSEVDAELASQPVDTNSSGEHITERHNVAPGGSRASSTRPSQGEGESDSIHSEKTNAGSPVMLKAE
ncbi:hypothetical protein M0805_005125 [Coniferiporia weirii]|nr:hypothetical protein M0805_005125 [Coniferiporia weirii]